MQVISLKMEPELLSEIDSSLKQYRYATRTEFIRDALREKLENLDVERRKERLAKHRGSAKNIKRLSKEELEKHAREFIDSKRDIFKEVGLNVTVTPRNRK